MSVTLMNVYDEVPPKCYFCGQPITEGPVVELLWTEAFVLNDTWAEEDPSYPGHFATEMDYSDCWLAHIGCIKK